MKSHKIFAAVLLMFCCLYSMNTFAWGRGHIGFYYGAPWYPVYGYGYPYPYLYPYVPPAVVSVPTVPDGQQTYMQQPVQAAQTNYWHYCHNPEGYYPYVKACPGGWQLVAPTPQQ